MVDTVTWSTLGGLLFTAKHHVDGLLVGGHRSLRRGPGVEFHDYRAYAPGDDFATIDWKLYGKTDRFYLRRYEREADLHAQIVVDASASMKFTGLDPRGRPRQDRMSKFDYARELAAAIAFLTIRQGDRAGLSIIDQTLHHHLPVSGTWAHLQRICTTLERAATTPGPGDLAEGLRRLHAVRARRGVLVVISDVLDEPESLFDALARFRHDRFDAIVLQVLTPEELDLKPLGRLRTQLVDSETRRQVATSLGDIAQRYGSLMRDHIETVRRGCVARAADHALILTDQPVPASLRQYLSRRLAHR